MKEIKINSINNINCVASEVLNSFGNNKIIAFYGKMGVGKTTLIKTICENMGVKTNISSPTFSLVNEYHADNGDIIYHFDVYRITQLEEAYDFGYEEYFFSGAYCFIEWPDKIEALLPNNTLRINIEEQDNGIRLITI